MSETPGRDTTGRQTTGRPGTGGIILCADDFAMTNGISRGIIELAEAGRISATSAMTTQPHWPSHATWLARVRGHIATGLHLNLTLGAPLGPIPRLAPNGRFGSIGEVTARAMLGLIDRRELRAEIERQFAAFESELGFAPDHVDGHQHVHALPIIRTVLIDVLATRYAHRPQRPLLRNPADRRARIVTRGGARRKALTLAAFSAGFAAAARSAGFTCNDGFGGVTDFSASNVAVDFAAACRAPGPRHLVMCHPGFVDDELARIDPVTIRRQCEYDDLMRGAFPATIWRPQRSASGDPIPWTTAWHPTT